MGLCMVGRRVWSGWVCAWWVGGCGVDGFVHGG